jgi:hypothetical protein
MPVSVGKWKIFWWHERIDLSEDLKACDPRLPHQWLRSLRANGDCLPKLRRLLAQGNLGDLWRLTDQAVVELAGRKLESRQIRILLQVEPFESFRSSDDPGSNPAPFPQEKRAKSLPSSSAARPLVDEAVFPEDAHLVAIAAVLQNAAQSGAPFCEECNKSQSS